MPRLAHLNLRTTRLHEVVDFYARVLGFRAGRAETRPDSEVHVWLYDTSGAPSVHVQGGVYAIGQAGGDNAGFHHVAFDCHDLPGWTRRLTCLGVPFEHAPLVGGLDQLNLCDPDGTRIELTFGAEALRLPPVDDLPAGP